jgi:hypothetical protein
MNGLEKCMNFGKIQDFSLLTYIGACQGPLVTLSGALGLGIPVTHAAHVYITPQKWSYDQSSAFRQGCERMRSLRCQQDCWECVWVKVEFQRTLLLSAHRDWSSCRGRYTKPTCVPRKKLRHLGMIHNPGYINIYKKSGNRRDMLSAGINHPKRSFTMGT